MSVSEERLLQSAINLCQKFVNKVESGRALSIETYGECKDLLAFAKEIGHVR